MNNNNYPQQKLRGMKRKYEAVQARGGKCERCGYSAILTSSCDKNSFSSEFGSVCPVCGKRFPKVTGKTFCSKECRETNKHYPTKSEVEEQYKLLGTWEKVASHYGISRRVIQRIRAKDSNQEVVGSSPAGPTQLIVESNE